MKGILAQKLGMTRVIKEDTGAMVPVTVLYAPENLIMQVKTADRDGYDSLVLAAFKKNKESKNGNKNYGCIQECCLSEAADSKKGDKVSVKDFEGVEKVKITGTSKGRGFSGVIKRHNFARGPETHGSHHHREPGSVGMCAKPGRILKGKKMPGQYGNVKVTLRSADLVSIDEDKNLIAVKGAVPGAKNSYVFLQTA